MSKRSHGDGGIDQRGENSFRLRYRLNGKRYSKAFRGTLSEAKKKLRELIRSGDTGTHVDPDKMSVRAWIEHWLSIGAPTRSLKRRKALGQRSIERYSELLNHHVLPAIGDRPLQQIQSTEIDRLYEQLSGKLSPTTVCNIHAIIGAIFATAMRTKKIARNPMLELAQAPEMGDVDHGMVLEQDQLRTLVAGFRGSPLFPIVAVAAFTGARRNEILALRWDDLNVADKTIRIERALEETDKHGLRMKAPKTARGVRTIKIDDELLSLLLGERERHLRIVAGIPDGTTVDLSLVKLPVGWVPRRSWKRRLGKPSRRA